MKVHPGPAAETIRDLLGDGAAREKLARRGRDFIAKHHSIAGYAKIMDCMLSGRMIPA